jgi:hypothetical protein
MRGADGKLCCGVARLFGYDEAMPRFGMKTIFASVTLFAAGVALLTIPLRYQDLWKANNFLAILLTCIPGALFGAAIGRPFKQTWSGAKIGLLLWVCIGIFILLVFPGVNRSIYRQD